MRLALLAAKPSWESCPSEFSPDTTDGHFHFNINIMIFAFYFFLGYGCNQHPDSRCFAARASRMDCG